MSSLNLTQVGRVAVSVADTDRALDFYVNTLGFEKVVDLPMGPDARWVEVAVAGTPTTVALAPPPPGKQAGGAETGIILDTTDVDADHATLHDAGVDVDAEVARYGAGIPPMFWLRDPDGNALCIVQPNG
ncbi:MAG TPA: VOC family protein [Gaiellaceae bacterium]|nr:VOC family protein [Gaiellaceae bacterium]